jgi:regulatory protein
MDELTKAKKRALGLLTDMDRTEQQIRDRLTRSGFSPDVTEAAIAYVKSYGYIDDRRYADHYIEVYRSRKSRLKISFDLQKKGLGKEMIAEAFSRAASFDEKPLIRALLEKKLKSLPADTPNRRQKLLAHLARKGFSTSDIISCIDEREDI